MTTKLFAAMVAIVALQLSGEQAYAENNRVKFPEDLDQLVHYMTVRRGNATERLSTTPEAIEAIKGGRPVPNGTRFVLTEDRDGKLFRYFVMEKGEGWGADYNRRAGDWQFQWFWPDKQINMDENTTRCISCHQSQRSRDYLYTAGRIREFSGKPIE